MCNKTITCLSQCENSIDNQNPYQAVFLMDSPSSTNPASTTGSNDDTPRLKFLCSFLGGIMPRPQDGKLRYVGGETRMVSLPRDVTYEDLMMRMRELYEDGAVLKYQQPDEDLDALVSVVNDDDVTNMMEEYDKLGSGDRFTRLRIFLFPHPDQNGSSHYVDGDERESERRYVDALNNLNDVSDFRKLQQSESPVMSPVDDIHMAEQFFNLHRLTIPHVGSGQFQQPITHRYNEMDAPWSPAYYSPRHHGHHDPRPLAEFPCSPSSARYRMPFGESSDKYLDRMPEEYVRQQVNHQPMYDHQPQYSENVVWLPNGAIPGDKTGFPGNILHGSSAVEGNSICDHCRTTFQRNQPYLEQPIMGNGHPQASNYCAECPPNRDTFMLNADTNLHRHNDPWCVYNDTQNHDRGWIPQNHMSSNFVHHRAGPEMANDLFHDQAIAPPPHVRIPTSEERGIWYGNMPYAYGTENPYPTSHGHVPGHVLRRNTQNPMHGALSYEAGNASHQVNGSSNPAFVRGGMVEGSPRFCIGADNQNPWVESSQKAFDGPAIPEYSYGHALKLNSNTLNQENQRTYALDAVRPPPDLLNFAHPPHSFSKAQLPHSSSSAQLLHSSSGAHLLHSSSAAQLSQTSSMLTHGKSVCSTTSDYNPESTIDTSVTEAVMGEDKTVLGQGEVANQVEKVGTSDVPRNSCAKENKMADSELINSNCVGAAEETGATEKVENDISEDPGCLVNHLIPELIDSVRRAAIEGVEEVKATGETTANSVQHEHAGKEYIANEVELTKANGEVELDSDSDILNTKIEPTKAEAEAISRGLQTIKNDDLEEIRELGSGTYGAVYHGKWKGSDVAVKRIKASCFAGRPSERERLIADFWKEALILSSLHHPNVVSFYGIVRDGPDGSLATVTEFMVNGSLKQFLQKKDRTIDRRKRLIIAMDAAFGMEYLHGKNIVHFDLKCENLLVNMRDPQRPVCKIGDLGLSKVKQHTLVSGGIRGTLPWMAPELLSGKSNMVTEKIDVYSFGIVMWELLTGDEPYANMHCASIIGGIVNNTLRPQIPTWCDPEWKCLMESSWASDPAARPSFCEISQKLRSMAAAINVK